MSILDKKGIGVTSGFKLVSGAPIDARFTAEDDTDLQSLIDNGAVYEGLEVYVKSLGKKKVYNGTEFVEVSAGGGSNVDIHIEDDTLVINTDGTSSGSGNTGGGRSGGINIFKKTLTKARKDAIIEFFGDGTDILNYLLSQENGSYNVQFNLSLKTSLGLEPCASANTNYTIENGLIPSNEIQPKLCSGVLFVGAPLNKIVKYEFYVFLTPNLEDGSTYIGAHLNLDDFDGNYLSTALYDYMGDLDIVVICYPKSNL